MPPVRGMEELSGYGALVERQERRGRVRYLVAIGGLLGRKKLSLPVNLPPYWIETNLETRGFRRVGGMLLIMRRRFSRASCEYFCPAAGVCESDQENRQQDCLFYGPTQATWA